MRTALVLLIASMPSTAAEDARALLEKVAETHRTAKSYRFESTGVRVRTDEFSESKSRSSEVLIRDGERVRFETRELGQSFLVVFDGENLWRASGDSREFVKSKTSAPLTDSRDGGRLASQAVGRWKGANTWLSTRLLENLSRAEIVGKEKVRIGNKDVQCIVVRAQYDAPKGSIGIEHNERTFWIDPLRHIVLRESYFTRGKLAPNSPFLEMESKFTRVYSVAELNQPVDPTFFTFTAPSDYVEVSSLEPYYPRPALERKGKPAPALALKTLDGEPWTLSSLKGKIVVLDFWATWCEPCRVQMPALAKLHQQTKDQDVVLVGINDDETPEVAKKYLGEKNYTWLNVHDRKEQQARTKFKVQGIPTLIVINREGLVAEVQLGVGEPSETAVRNSLRKLGVRLP